MSALGTTPADCARQLAVQFGWQRGERREVRVLHGSAKRRALVDSPAAAAAFACRQPRGAGVYVTMNALAATAADRFAADVDVPHRVRFALDFDPVRPSGTPATDAQLDAARALGAEVERFLVAHGWPVPVRMDSGNGVHAYWRTDLGTASPQPRALLKALHARFGTDRVAVDVTIHNPARIMRAAGCWNCKGTEAPDAPHRVACVTHAGEPGARALEAEDFDAVLRALGAADRAPEPAKRTPAPRRYAGGELPRLDVGAWLARHCIAHRGAREWRCADGIGTRWVLAACPFNVGHDRGEAVVTQAASGAVAFRCQHHGCAAHSWRELRELIEGPRVDVLDMFKKAGKALRREANDAR
ncbi:MAG: hypothetical protein KGS47_15505 [Chloroflexi bacterium]|nr:hypothetical protein [Chloroflexota bacterium]